MKSGMLLHQIANRFPTAIRPVASETMGTEHADRAIHHGPFRICVGRAVWTELTSVCGEHRPTIRKPYPIVGNRARRHTNPLAQPGTGCEDRNGKQLSIISDCLFGSVTAVYWNRKGCQGNTRCYNNLNQQ